MTSNTSSTSNGHTSSKNRSLIQIPKKQRVMILQGGGALGAYELGVLEAIYEKIKEEEGQEEVGVNLFDIVAGASIGAINAVLLVNYFLNNNKSWKDSPDELEIFWKELTAHTWAEVFLNNMFSDFWWDLMRAASYNYIASAESVRRYNVEHQIQRRAFSNDRYRGACLNNFLFV